MARKPPIPQRPAQAKKQTQAINPSIAQTFQQGIAAHQSGQLEQAKAAYQKVLEQQPQHFEALHLLGVIELQTNQPESAQELIGKAIAIAPNYAAAHYNRGIALRKLNRLDEALTSYGQALEIQPAYPEVLYNRGNLLKDIELFDEALASYDQAIALKSDYALVFSNRGTVLEKLKRDDDALASYDKAIAINPDYANAFYNRGTLLQKLKRFDDALASFNKALAINPGFSEGFNNRGAVLAALKRFDEALASYDQALALKPDYADAFNNRGNALGDLKRFDEALASYDQALGLKPNYEFLFGLKLHTQMQLCDWRDLLTQCEQLVASLMRHQKVTPPFPVLGLIDQPALHLQAAKIWAESKFPAATSKPQFKPRAAGDKIRIGYYSADFHNHATSYLMAELFEAHDADKFELFGFSFGPKKQDEMRQRVARTFDQFFDVSQQSDQQVAQLSRELGIDIAVDLKGFTQDARTGIFAQHCAPIQINYLGYPGTLAAPYFDYIVADKTVIPETSQSYYTEKVIYLPHSYQVNDGQRKISDKVFTRQELGLPEEGFVFCCFNNNYKILPATFEVWMRLLQAVEGSVLWLFQDNPTAANNLRKEAQRLGVDPARLVFAPRMALPDHLARHRAADLFLDTLPYNAHTTASDALWAGLPVLTLLGESFAARVAGSLLYALDMPELVTHTPEQYEAKALELATKPSALAQVKEKLAKQRLTSPLFNGQLFARHLEAAYTEIQRRQLAGEPPSHLDVAALHTPSLEVNRNEVTKPAQAPVNELEVLHPRLTAPSPNIAQVLQQGLVAHQSGQLEQAKAAYQKVLAQQPQHFDALHLLGVIALDTNNLELALELIGKAIAIKPDYAAALNNRGTALAELKRFNEALTSYDQALALKPDDANALYNRGNVLQAVNRFDEALSSYDKALAIEPNFAKALYDRGVALAALKRFDEALASYDQALTLKPDYAEAFNNRGIVFAELKRLKEALKSYDQALALKPNYEFLFGHKLHTQMQLCDWRDVSAQIKQLEDGLAQHQKVAYPFGVLGLIDQPELQLQAAKIWTESKCPAATSRPQFKPRAAGGKIRIGYYSADFHNHAVSHQIAELFEVHDTEKFEIYGFSFGSNRQDEMRQRLAASFHQFLDVSQHSDLQIVQLSRDLDIDIAVDLMGFTQDARIGIFAQHCAPIQLSYIGYPGTLAAPYFDYIVADKIVIPETSQSYYTEKVIYLPHSYQVNDSQRKISDKVFTRQELGLPETGFVFCCFNNNYKIWPTIFEAWMRLLNSVEGSVLWLLQDNPTAGANLRKEAQLLGVNPDRLVFAPRMAYAEYLARHRAADLFLDTWPYNAHGTASGALWAGLPILTLMGQSFASRVGASLLYALDMPELVTHTPEQYEARALELATHPAALAQIKEKLAKQRLTAPLFNGQLFARHLEAAYTEIQRRQLAGEPPTHLDVAVL